MKCALSMRIYIQVNILMMKMSPLICKMLTCPKLNDQEKKFCDSLPTIHECTDAVNNLKNNKSPGLDGLPGEFYKCFWKTIKPLFYDVLLCVF